MANTTTTTTTNIQTYKYYFKNIKDIIQDTHQPISKPKIRIVNAGCFEVADSLESSRIVIHNFANNKFQGGPCSKFTEDGLFISSKLWSNTLLTNTSVLGNTQEDQLIKRYRENILLPLALYPICKDNAPENTALLYSQCGGVLCDVITIAALQDPNYMKSSQRTTMINRIKLILAVCAKYNKILITGLWGCGAFGGKPEDLAELWQEALCDSTIPKPPEIIFAIKIDRASSKWGSFENMEKLLSKIVL